MRNQTIGPGPTGYQTSIVSRASFAPQKPPLAILSALAAKTFYPYGDFLLHDVGTGDGIVMAMQEHYGRNMYQVQWKNFSPNTFTQTANKMRTAPLWGVRLRPRLMHDGTSLTLLDAIERHRGEASEAEKKFDKLKHQEQEELIQFLKSL